MARKASNKSAARKADAAASAAATRREAIAAYGNRARSGGRAVWTQANGRAKASKDACRRGKHGRDW